MSGKAKDPRQACGEPVSGAMLLVALLVLLGPRPLKADVICPKTNGTDCICDSRKETDQQGGWDLNCQEYRIEYAIRSFVKIECYPGQQEPYMPSMFQKYNLTDVNKFQFVTCPLSTNVSLAELLEGTTVKSLKFEGETVRSLKFEGELPRTILDSHTFRGLESVDTLLIRQIPLESVAGDTFTNLTGLKVVEMNDNSLQSLPDSLFQDLENMTTILLTGNELEELPENIFSNLTKLQRLYLYKNKLRELPAGIFAGLSALTVLDLNSNEIQELRREHFADLSELHHLNIRKNNFTRLESDMFRGLKNLGELDFSDNKLTKLPEDLLDGLVQLKKIFLNNCNLKGIGEAFFSYTPNLEVIRMYNNRLISLPQDLFAHNGRLQELNTHYNDLLELPSKLFDKNYYLKTLKIAKNNLTSLPEGILDNLVNLTDLDLSGNSLKTLHPDLLLHNQNLTKLDVSKNNLIELVGKYPFGLSSLIEEVNFKDNHFTSFPHINFALYVNLKKIVFRNNNLTSFTVPSGSEKVETQIELEYNQISNVDMENVPLLESIWDKSKAITKVQLLGNPLNCDCKLFKFFNYSVNKRFRKKFDFVDIEELKCHEPSWLNQTKVIDVTPETFVCQETDACPANCYCINRAVDSSAVVNCSYLTELPATLPPRTTEVHLEGNHIKNLDGLSTRAWRNVTKIFLDHNEIEAAEWPPFSSKLKTISLRGNRLDHLPRSLAEFVNTTDVQLFLGDNPWLCNCETLELKNWLYENKYANDLKVKDIGDMHCSNLVFLNGSEVRTTVGRLTEDICPSENEVDTSHVIIVSVVCAILACLLFVVSVLYYRNKQTVIAYFYINFYNVFVCFFNDDDLDEDKTFDAFVSYSSADRDVALDLVGQLESGDPSFKLCIHERDWLPGNLISWNIVNSVQNSRRTILVLSKDFLESVWFQVEFHTAYYQMLEDRIDRLIVIVKGELPDKNTLDKDLQLLISTKTFLEWGERWFWEKLRYALPHRRSTGKGLSVRKDALQDKGLPLRQRPHPGLLKTVEEKIVSLSGETIFPKRTESPALNSDAQGNANPTPNNNVVNSVSVNSTKAQSRRFNSPRANSQDMNLQNGIKEMLHQQVPLS